MTPRWRVEGRDWPNADASRFVDAGGLRWHVQVSGTGPAIVLLHGTGASSHSWRGVVPGLSQDFTVVVPDLPRHGFTAPLTVPSLPNVARAVARLLATLGVEPVVIAGHSAGAAIALRLSLDAPHQLPVVGFGGALLPFPGLAAKLFPALAKLLFVNPLMPALLAARARDRATVARFLRGTGSTLDARGIDFYARLFACSGHVAGALAMMANWDLTGLGSDFARITAPLILAHGDRDSTVPPAVSREVAARVAGAQVVPLAGLGHLAHEERPDLALDLITAAAGG